MKKKTYIVAIIVVVLIVVGIVAVAEIEKNKTNVTERYTEKNTGVIVGEDNETILKPDSGLVKDGVAEFVYEDPMINQDIVHTFLAYDFVEGKEIINQSKYPRENFAMMYTEEPTETISQTWFDWEQFEKDYPELRMAYRNMYSGEYSEDEIEDIEKQFEELRDDYTNVSDYDVSYVFLKCRFENSTNSENELFLNNMRGMLTNDDYSDYLICELCYFDKAQNVEGEDRAKGYYIYTMQPGEILECIIGIQVYKEGKETDAPELDNIYFGYEDVLMYNDYMDGISPYSPIYGKFVFKVMDLKEMQSE